MSEAGRQRIDKWLWYARVTKSRSLAQKLATSGHVRLNKEKVAASSQTIKLGDVLTIAHANRVRVLRVVDLGSRRGPASEAQALYEDLSPEPQKPAEKAADLPAELAERPRGAGRPTKRERRDIDRLRSND